MRSPSRLLLALMVLSAPALAQTQPTRAPARASDTVLQNALLTREIAPALTDEAIKAKYDKDYAGKAGEEEVRAAHILVPDEAKAKDIIAQIEKGADFAALAKANSTDP